MRTITVTVKIITFVHKITGETASFTFGEGQDVADSFCGTVFGENYDCTGFWKVQRAMQEAGHTEVVTEEEIEIKVPKIKKQEA